MRQTLILNAIDPRIGGVLIRGERGTAKSTTARALAALLPRMQVITDCRFGCDPGDPATWCDECRERSAKGEQLPVSTRFTPFVNLPVSATEDRVVGTLDIEKAIQGGERCFEPGLLAAANRGLLYIDEVNLLDDHLVDILLDAAAMGVNIVEREGISFRHPARFMLVGTMNPEEGEIRPQLLDRFGLSVNIHAVHPVSERVEIVKRNLAFDASPSEFYRKWSVKENELSQQIERARRWVKQVTFTDENLLTIASLTNSLGVDGHRADAVILKAARAWAAYMEQPSIRETDILLAAELALPHRIKLTPVQPGKKLGELLQRHSEQAQADIQSVKTILDTIGENLPMSENAKLPMAQAHKSPRQLSKETDLQPSRERSNQGGDEDSTRLSNLPGASSEDSRTDIPLSSGSEPKQSGVNLPAGQAFEIRRLTTPLDRMARRLSGRRSPTYTRLQRGRYVRFRPAGGNPTDLAFDATLRTAAPYQSQRVEQRKRVAFAIRPVDFQRKVRVSRAANLLVFVVDTSTSMMLVERMTATKGAILSLLADAYLRRDRVGLITYNKNKAKLVLPPTNSIELAEQALKKIEAEGTTPLSDGLYQAYHLISREKLHNPAVMPLLLLITDGEANVSISYRSPRDEALAIADLIASENIRSVVINVETLGLEDLPQTLAEHLKAPCYRIADLSAEALVRVVHQERIPLETAPDLVS